METGRSVDRGTNSCRCNCFWMAGWLVTILIALGGCTEPSKPGTNTRPTTGTNTAIGAYGTIKLARLDYAGNADPEPGGWRHRGVAA